MADALSGGQAGTRGGGSCFFLSWETVQLSRGFLLAAESLELTLFVSSADVGGG